MKISRRTFLATGVAGLAASYAGCQLSPQVADIPTPPDEDGSKLWLRYAPLGENRRAVAGHAKSLIIEGQSPTASVIRSELQLGLTGLLGSPVPLTSDAQNGSIVVGTVESSRLIRSMNLGADLEQLGPDGFLIRSSRLSGRSVIVIAAQRDVGALYGAFHFLRMVERGDSLDHLAITQRPRLQLRLLNHWDNLNGTIERGYAGRSLWNWSELPGALSARYTEYARANASLGINGAVLNNVNADVRILTPEYLHKVAALADLWRAYGIRVYLSANFAAPVTLGRLATADPLDAGVIAWWKAKVDEIYALIPDFGGFLVKANSEGQPGPQDYHRTHAQGANLLADALAPHKGHVIWRAFIYDETVDPDRAKRAYIEFMALEGQFRPNVLIQVKNGPIDFQPREPFHPLFGAMRQTPVLAELQATQEYLGQAKHLVYLGTMWKEFLDSDTFADGPGSTVGKVLEAPGSRGAVTGMAAVLNTGMDANWCGHHFSQANWYAFGRLAWDHRLSAEAIADEWIRQTFSRNAATVQTIRDMMMSSHETFVNYTMPLGLHHLIGGDHYAPMPWNANAPRRDWTAVYYHQASPQGIGFDRTRQGDKAVDQYFPPVRDQFDNLVTCPEKFLLWFHRVAWDYKTKSGRTLWQELCHRYHLGARQAADLQATWISLSAEIDEQRHREVARRLAIQVAAAAEWREDILKYFQGFSGMSLEPLG